VELTRFHRDSPVPEIVRALQRDGAAIVEKLVDAALADKVLADLRPRFDADGTSTQSDFNGFKTLRVNSVLDFSRSSAEIVGHGKMLEVIDPILLPHCINYQIGSNTAIEIYPGETAQRLHRDDSIYPVQLPGLELQVSVMWALDDFTVENGATRVVPGSHRWTGLRDPDARGDVVQAPMSKGSALFYLGSVWHGGGANLSSKPRAGLINTYSLGWLRPEVNHHVMVPREMVLGYPLHLQKLIGYTSHGGRVGWYDSPNWPDGTDGAIIRR